MSDEIGAVAEVVESPSVETNQQDDFTPPAGSDESIDWRKHSKEYRDFLKTMGAGSPTCPERRSRRNW